MSGVQKSSESSYAATEPRYRATLPELSPEELKALGHSLRMVPSNTMVGARFLWEDEAFKSLWEKVAHAINTRSDMEQYRVKP